MDFTSRNEKFQAKSSANATPIGSLILDLPPSCIEFVPVSKNVSWTLTDSLFVVGTYDLQKEEQGSSGQVEDEAGGDVVAKVQSRQGSLSLYKLKDDILTELQTFSTPSAILDLHFFHDTTIFAVASSTGTISLFEISVPSGLHELSGTHENLTSTQYRIQEFATHQILDDSTIITYFTWDKGSPCEAPRMAITSTTGVVTTLRFSKDFKTYEFENDGEAVTQHDFEAWCCAFSENGEILYSGGDDAKLIMSSLHPSNPSTRRLPFHNAGVTMILPIPTPELSPESPELLLTGSYDDFIRVYQPPSLYSTKPKVLVEKDIGCSGGGVWRLKFLNDHMNLAPLLGDDGSSKRKFLVLASCMRVGCKVLEITESDAGEWTIEVLARTAIHESMNYASDVVPVRAREKDVDIDAARTIVSTSFYDRLLFIWKYDPGLSVREVLD